MTVSFTWQIEMDFGAGFVDVTHDVRTVSPKAISRGIDGAGITDRVAKVGTFAFALDNSAKNTVGTMGYYSPDSVNCRSGFGLGTKTRMTYTYGTIPYYKYYGKISDLTPTFGQLKERYTSVNCVDFMNELLVHNLNGLAVQSGKRGHELIGTIVANLPTAPLATSYATGPDIFAYALHDVKDEQTTGMNAIQRVDQSGLSYTFVKGDLTGGETLTWQSRHTRLMQTSAGTFNGSMIGMTVTRRADSIYNTIKATGYPASIGTANETLWTSQKEIIIDPSGTVTFTARYTDPSSGGSRVALVPGSEVTPVAGTDYRMSSTSSGSGSDLNGNLVMTPTWYGNTASIQLVNSSAVTGYVNLCMIRGKIIRLYDPAESVKTDATSKTAYGDRTLTMALPYQDSVNTLDAFSTELLSRLKAPYSTIDALEFVANDSAGLMALAMALDVGSRITVTEGATGLSSDDYFVNTYELILEPGKLICKLGNLEAAGVSGNVGLWGTIAADSGDWGTGTGDATNWTF